MQILESKTGSQIIGKENTLSLASLFTLEVSCQDVDQREKQPD